MSQGNSDTVPTTNNLTVGLAHNTRESGQQGIGVTISKLSNTSVLVGFEKSLLKNQCILSGTNITTFSQQEQYLLAKDLSETQQYQKMQSICNTMNLQLKTQNASFIAQYETERRNSADTSKTIQHLGLTAQFNAKDFIVSLALKAHNTNNQKKLQMKQVQVNTAYKIDTKAMLQGSISYDFTTKQFIPKFSLISNF